jgi:hypothetical protein
MSPALATMAMGVNLLRRILLSLFHHASLAKRITTSLIAAARSAEFSFLRAIERN